MSEDKSHCYAELCWVDTEQSICGVDDKSNWSRRLQVNIHVDTESDPDNVILTITPVEDPKTDK